MKCTALLALALQGLALVAGGQAGTALAGLQKSRQFPGGPAGAVTAVTQLLRDWSSRLELQGKEELASYDKYACWCEDTLARKARDISDAKKQIDSLQKHIEKLSGESASHDAEIEHLKKLIQQNKQEQQEAADVRSNENAEFEGEKTEGEQCVGALEAAIKVLSGAGEGTKLLQTMKEAEILSVVGGVRAVLKKAAPSRRVSPRDLDFARKIFAEPAGMLSHTQRSGAALLAVDNNPFGDYAPQSTRIQGVLKSLYDSFAMDLEKGNVEEADAQKSFEELMKTKKAELATLEATLEIQEADTASKKKDLAESKALRVDVQEQLKADEAFFATTKDGCKAKAIEWGERVRLRTQELQGITKAIEILSNDEARETFANSSSQLVQLGSTVKHTRLAALQKLVERSGSKSLASIILQAQTGGYFDKVMGEIDEMIALLRREEKQDIFHRDRCQNAQNDNSNSKDELTNNVEKAGDEIARMEHEQKQLSVEIEELAVAINKTEQDMEEALMMRNEERRDFERSVKDDTAAIAILEKALDALVAFYKRNKIPMLLQHGQPTGAEYTIDPDKAPETIWDAGGADYTGSTSENEGVVAIISMIIEDIQKEISESRKDDADAQASYEKNLNAFENTLLMQKQSHAAMERRLQELDEKVGETQDFKDAKQDDLSAQEGLSKTLLSDCSWVETHFKSRAENRKKELDGLVAAKNYLAGVSDGSELAP